MTAKKQKRKIIQIAATPENGEQRNTITALCDDGTVWTTWYNASAIIDVWSDWEQVPDIPQE